MSRLPEDFDELDDHIEGDPNQFDLQDLERTILAASNYVVPSDNLRPRTLDKARELTNAKVNTFKIGFAAIFGLSAWGCFVLLVSLSSSVHERFVSPFGNEMQHIAAELSTTNREGIDWALVDAFIRYRKVRGIQ